MANEKTTPAKREQTRQHILDTALDLFLKQGFEKTTMRAIAAEASLSLGAAYYHFQSKEELVLAFYQQTAEEAREQNVAFFATTRDFKKRFQAILDFKLQQLRPYRSLIKVLVQQAADLQHPLSPFSAETEAIREDAISLIQLALDDSNIRIAKKLGPHLAKLLWLYQMGIIFFWTNDQSHQQRRSDQLLSLSLSLLLRLFRISTLPLMSPVNQSMLKIIQLVEACTEPGAPIPE